MYEVSPTTVEGSESEVSREERAGEYSKIIEFQDGIASAGEIVFVVALFQTTAVSPRLDRNSTIIILRTKPEKKKKKKEP